MRMEERSGGRVLELRFGNSTSKISMLSTGLCCQEFRFITNRQEWSNERI